MQQQEMREQILKRSLLWIVCVLLVIFSVVACANNGGNSPPPESSPASTPFTVTSVDLAVTPNSIAGRTCGSAVQFTYTATFHVPEGTAGGKIEFSYTTNNGRSSTSASVNVGPGETTKVFTFNSSGTLPPDHTYPGVAQVQVTSPNAINSPQVIPAGTCVQAGTFAVTSIDMAVQPTSIAGKACGTAVTVTYTATFHIAANSPGGTIQFLYTWNNGRASPSASVQVAPGQTTATYSFTWSGTLSPDHVLPSYGGVIVTSPNAISSPMVKPDGACS